MSPFDNLRKHLQKSEIKDQNIPQEFEERINIKPQNISYNDWGFKQAGRLAGGINGLLASLKIVAADFIQTETNNTSRQEENRQKAITQKKQLEEKKDNLISKNNIIENKISEIKTSISNLKKGISEIRKNPKIVMPDKISKVGFIIGLLILLVLTIYLFIFYSSASYSAFFKEFTLSKLGIASSIFDPKAMSNALKDGTTELILIITMPFVFIGLGFLIHKFQEQKGYGKFFKIALLIFVTFVFDAILAYEITAKIYNIKAMNSFADMPPYSVEMAFHSVNFWLIIFAGFIVYIIWGFVFDFTMEAYDKLDIVKQAIKAKEREITELEKNQTEENFKGEKITDEISQLNNDIHDRDKIINGEKFQIDTDKFENLVHQFFNGWLRFLEAGNFNQTLILESSKTTNNFIQIYLNRYKSNLINQ